MKYFSYNSTVIFLYQFTYNICQIVDNENKIKIFACANVGSFGWIGFAASAIFCCLLVLIF
jgi:hypothetical protein